MARLPVLHVCHHRSRTCRTRELPTAKPKRAVKTRRRSRTVWSTTIRWESPRGFHPLGRTAGAGGWDILTPAIWRGRPRRPVAARGQVQRSAGRKPRASQSSLAAQELRLVRRWPRGSSRREAAADPYPRPCNMNLPPDPRPSLGRQAVGSLSSIYQYGVPSAADLPPEARAAPSHRE